MKSHPAFVAALSVALPTAQGQTPVERGKYLAVIGDCIDCHTPGYFFGKPDMTRYPGDNAAARIGCVEQAATAEIRIATELVTRPSGQPGIDAVPLCAVDVIPKAHA